VSLLTRFTRSVVVLLCLSLGWSVTEAGAGSVSYIETYPLSPYLNSGTFNWTPASFPKFDLAGQCLTSVCVRVDGGLYGEIAFENYQNYPVTVNVAFTALISVKRPSFSPIITVQPLANTSDNLPSFDGVLDYGGASGRTYTGVNPTRSDSLCLTAASDLALFSGAGTIGLPAEAVNLSSQTGASSWSIGPKAYASVKVTYNYQECTVPADRTSWGRIKQTYR